MNKRLIETAVGLFVLLGIISLTMLAINASGLRQTFSESNGYEVKAYFSNIGNLKQRSKVTLSGVNIGRVKEINIDKNSLDAEVVLYLDNEIALPKDSSASILTSGLLGDTYIAIEPGAEEKNLNDGGVIDETHSALVLEKLIHQFLFNKEKL